MYLWHLTRTNKMDRYDTFDEAVVAAPTLADALATHPGGPELALKEAGKPAHDRTWPASITEVSARHIGRAVTGTPAGVIVASFNAG